MKELNLDHLHRVHCVGVGGIGVSAVAKLLRLQGKEVSGSDVARTVVTEEAAAAGVIVKDEDPENIHPDLDLIIYTPAAGDEHPERKAAAAFGIPQLSYPEFLGLLSRSYETIAVTGTNGKSTTTAMLGLILEAAGLDPLVIVGSRVTTFPYGNLRPHSGQPVRRLFVVEACEYRAGLLNITPTHAVITNVAHDHPDFFRDVAHVREVFQKFLDPMTTEGILVRNGGDAESLKIVPKGRDVTFGFDQTANYQATEHRTEPGIQRFQVNRNPSSSPLSKGREFGPTPSLTKRGQGELRLAPIETWEDMTLRVPGKFNVENALAAAAMARELGVPSEIIRGILSSFTGVWRRFERLGEKDGVTVISDYGHHPDAVKGTLEAAKEFFPGRRVVLVFQPHHHDRTRKLFDAFVPSFDAADALVLAEIYGVAGRKEHQADISSKDLLEAIEARDKAEGKERPLQFAADPAAAEALAREWMQEGDVLIIMGAGDIYAIAKKLVE